MILLVDALVHSSNMENHKKLLRDLFDILKNEQQYEKKAECGYNSSSVEFVGHVVTTKRIEAQAHLKVTVLEWPALTTIRPVRQFILLTNYYRKLIKEHASTLQPVAVILRTKNFCWS